MARRMLLFLVERTGAVTKHCEKRMVHMIVQCCVCKKIRQDGGWVEPKKWLDPENVSHGYCPACAAEAFAEIRRWINSEKRAACAAGRS